MIPGPSDYPPESQKMNIIAHLEEMRRRILIVLAVLALTSGLAFCQAETLVKLAYRPLEGIIDKLIFIAPTEVFAAYLKMAVLFGFFMTFPVLLYEAWAFLTPALAVAVRHRALGWIIFALVCFWGGLAFAYYLALPAALKFLLGFAAGVAVPQITIGRYISFFVVFVLISGLIFEIPVIIALLADVGIVTAGFLRKERKMAAVVILIVAALITPTQDIFNMMVFAVPMMLLYELGIMLAWSLEHHREKKNPVGAVR